MNKMDNMMELFSDPPILPGRNLCLRPLELRDTEALQRLTKQDAVYRYLPTFLFEKKYEASEVIGIDQNSGCRVIGYRCII